MGNICALKIQPQPHLGALKPQVVTLPLNVPPLLQGIAQVWDDSPLAILDYIFVTL